MGNVWFGTREHMQWIPAPQIDVSAGKVGFSAVANFLNGGAGVRRSKAGAKQFSLSWNMKHRDEVRPILDYADGLYGDGYIYYSNPFANDKNILPAYWATPYINAYDGPLFWNNVRPTIFKDSTPQVQNGFPVEAASYTMNTGYTYPKLYVPIPPGFRLHIGAHGTNVSGTSTIKVTPYSGVGNATPGTVTSLTLLPRTGALTNYVTPAGATGAELQYVTTANGVLRMHGVIAQLLPTGAVSPVGEFISGQGTSGMAFVSQPSVSEYSAALDRVGVSADLIEVEAWA